MAVISIENVHILILYYKSTRNRHIYLGPVYGFCKKPALSLNIKNPGFIIIKIFLMFHVACFLMQVGCETSADVRPSALPKKTTVLSPNF
jgi:hypothetical protein